MSWKTLAIVFMILFVLETSLIIFVYNLGTKQIDNRTKCSNEVCFNAKASAFVYDDSTSTCSCYEGDNIIKQEILK